MLPLIVAAAVMLGIALLLRDVLGLRRRRRPTTTDYEPQALGYLDRIRRDLREAGIEKVTPGKFLANAVILSLGTFVATMLATGTSLSFERPPLVAAAAGLLTFRGFRGWYIGRAANKRDMLISQQVSEAAEIMGTAITAGSSPEDAMGLYARRAIKGSGLFISRDDKPQIVATALLQAREDMNKGLHESTALQGAATNLGNRFFTALVEVYVQNRDVSGGKVQEGFRRLAEQVDWSIRLFNERRTGMLQPLYTYLLIGVIIVGLLGYLVLMAPAVGGIISQPVGQLFLLGVGGWYLLGYKLQRKNVQDRL